MYRVTVPGSGLRTICVFAVGPDQMKAFEEFITRSPNATPIAKKTLLWMIRQSESLSRPVALSIPPLDDDPPEPTDSLPKDALPFSDQVAYSVHDMDSSGGKTHIDLFLRAMGSPMKISSHCGRYEGTESNDKAGGHTIWIALEPYGWGGHETYRHLPFDREAILAIPVPTTTDEE